MLCSILLTTWGVRKLAWLGDSSARSSRQGWCTVGEGGGGLQGYSAVLAIPKNNKPINPLQTVQVRNPVTRNLPRPPGRPLRKDRAGRKGGCVRKFCRSTGQYFACIFRYIYIYIYIPLTPPRPLTRRPRKFLRRRDIEIRSPMHQILRDGGGWVTRFWREDRFDQSSFLTHTFRVEKVLETRRVTGEGSSFNISDNNWGVSGQGISRDEDTIPTPPPRGRKGETS